ncbi:antibiotic biosynthesis monooxygenase [Ammonicoccus fulvus]|uniref:Antibiotic biosynthesis monooxygenase n=1 Tax=Ammonicoccus fulvus TaxID=3138240 RepID=A0ABZ3FKI7_9ACTN
MSEEVVDSTVVTRIARRRALPGHEHAYEENVREMFERMKEHQGFAGAEIIPPESPGCAYQVVVNFDSEADLAAWDNSGDRRAIFAKMRDHAEGEPQHRRLNALEEWFVGPSVPATTKPPRWKTAIVTWMGIWPLASLFIWLGGFWNPGFKNLPFLATTAVNVALIVLTMTFLVAPVLTKLMRPFLVGKPQTD